MTIEEAIFAHSTALLDLKRANAEVQGCLELTGAAIVWAQAAEDRLRVCTEAMQRLNRSILESN